MYGAFFHFSKREYSIPGPLFLCLPVAYAFSLMSGSLERMFIASFAVVIPLALIGLEKLMSSPFPGKNGEDL